MWCRSIAHAVRSAKRLRSARLMPVAQSRQAADRFYGLGLGGDRGWPIRGRAVALSTGAAYVLTNYKGRPAYIGHCWYYRACRPYRMSDEHDLAERELAAGHRTMHSAPGCMWLANAAALRPDSWPSWMGIGPVSNRCREQAQCSLLIMQPLCWAPTECFEHDSTAVLVRAVSEPQQTADVFNMSLLCGSMCL